MIALRVDPLITPPRSLTASEPWCRHPRTGARRRPAGEVLPFGVAVAIALPVLFDPMRAVEHSVAMLLAKRALAKSQAELAAVTKEAEVILHDVGDGLRENITALDQFVRQTASTREAAKEVMAAQDRSDDAIEVYGQFVPVLQGTVSMYSQAEEARARLCDAVDLAATITTRGTPSSPCIRQDYSKVVDRAVAGS